MALLSHIFAILIIMIYFPSLIVSVSSSQWLPKVIWTYWQKPIPQSDHLHQIFARNRHTFLQGWQLRHLDQMTVWHWLNRIPDFNYTLNRTQFKLDLPAKRANLIRIALIKHFGGVWLDYTMILTQSLDWLFKLKQQQLVYNKYGENPQLLLLFNAEHGNMEQVYDEQTRSYFYIHPTYEVFFIAGKPKNKFAQEWFDMYVYGKAMSFKQYNKYRPEDYDTKQDSWIVQTKKSQKIESGKFHIEYFQFQIAAQIVLQRKQRELESQSKQKNSNQPRPLAVKYYNIWTMSTNQTAYILQSIQSQSDLYTRIINILMQSDIEYLQEKKIFPQYFLKIYHTNMETFKEYLSVQPPDNQTNIPLYCPQTYFILQNSIANVYLFRNYPTKFFNNPIIEFGFNKNCIMPKNNIDIDKYKRIVKVIGIITSLFLIGIIGWREIQFRKKIGNYVPLNQTSNNSDENIGENYEKQLQQN